MSREIPQDLVDSIRCASKKATGPKRREFQAEAA